MVLICSIQNLNRTYKSVTFSNIYLTKLEIEKVKPTNPLFYKQSVDDVINKREKNNSDLLPLSTRNYLPNINFAVEFNPSKFLDINIKTFDGGIGTNVYRKQNKMPVHRKNFTEGTQ